MQKFYSGYFRRMLSTVALLLLTVTVWGGSKDLKVLQLNIWINGTIVPGGVEGLVDVIDRMKPDVVFLCELAAGSDNPLSQHVIDELGNTDAKLEQLVYTPDADERERIDFIYYYPQSGIKLTAAQIVGPAASVCRGKITPNDAGDRPVEPKCVWPSDHKGNMAVFKIKKPLI